MKNKLTQGQHLTETVYQFRPHTKITIEETERFLTKLVKVLKVKETHRHVNNLPPGFDILVGLKESCLYLGYWPEHDYVRLIASSCKQYDKDKVSDLIIQFFNLENTVYIDVRKDCPIKDITETLWKK